MCDTTGENKSVASLLEEKKNCTGRRQDRASGRRIKEKTYVLVFFTAGCLRDPGAVVR